jgi:UDP-N-acetylmuramate dehydrogenase
MADAEALRSASFDDLVARHKLLVQENVPAARATTIAAGGQIAALFEISSILDLQRIYRDCLDLNLSPRVLGAGSNLLVPDGLFLEPVLRFGRSFRSWEKIDSHTIRVQASMPVMNLARDVARTGLSGLEFAAGIPASLGGAIFMNAGAHNSDFSEIVKSVHLMLPDGEPIVLAASELKFIYRSANLPLGAIVTAADLSLVESDAEAVQAAMRKNLEYRKLTQPLHLPSCGSVFRNPLPEYAGALIEACGLKGRSFGGATISEQHANWIVNPSKVARACDVMNLIRLCQAEVRERYSLELEPEVQLW